MQRLFFAAICLCSVCGELAAEVPPELRIGQAGHAFDHLGGIGGQAEAAVASGASIIYSGGLGEAGYHGLPAPNDFVALRKSVSDYSRRAKQLGIELNIGYLCATSMVKLDTFDKHWTDEFRAQFKTRPAEWRQEDRRGKPLASWYGGDYQPACMSNPDWRAYERAMVRYQLATGHDGVFFDNPTVHPQGCYCEHCMKAFAKYLESSPLAPREESISRSEMTTLSDAESIRKVADKRPEDFLRFRTTIARDFLADIRTYARSINPRALITCNNSLNSPEAFYSQSRKYAYNIDEMSKAEDFVVVEDENNQPRIEANGQTVEYGPIYKLLHAISHDKPIVAVTIVGGDYHTPPNLMRLAMAEAAANGASYLSWPTWPEEQRKRMSEAVRPQAEFLHRNEKWLNDAPARADVVVLLPFRRWVQTDSCPVLGIASALTGANLQYKVVGENELSAALQNGRPPVLVVESRSVLTSEEQETIARFETAGGRVVPADQQGWLEQIRKNTGLLTDLCRGPKTVRMVVHDHPQRTVVHLYNLNIQRLSSFEDKVTAANDVRVAVRTPFRTFRFAHYDSADEGSPHGEIHPLGQYNEGNETVLYLKVPLLKVSGIITIEGN